MPPIRSPHGYRSTQGHTINFLVVEKWARQSLTDRVSRPLPNGASRIPLTVTENATEPNLTTEIGRTGVGGGWGCATQKSLIATA